MQTPTDKFINNRASNSETETWSLKVARCASILAQEQRLKAEPTNMLDLFKTSSAYSTSAVKENSLRSGGI